MLVIPGLPPAASAWTITSSVAAAVSYADRGTSAIAASGIIADLHWTESQLGNVQSSFFLGYGLTQVLGGLLSEGTSSGEGGGAHEHDDSDNELGNRSSSTSSPASDRSSKQGNYRIVLPLSLLLTAITTLLFPSAAIYGGPTLAAIDRFVLGLLEGLLLPSAMFGISQLVPKEKSATSSSILIAGCYLGSALAYISATILFSSPIVDIIQTQDSSAWPYVFYVNGILSLILLVASKSEFDFSWLSSSVNGGSGGSKSNKTTTRATSNVFQVDTIDTMQNLVVDTINVGKATIQSTSGRAIIAAQIGQGALLYSIASWGPLYIEQVVGQGGGGVASVSASAAAADAGNQAIVTAAAASAAASLIVPQFTQAAVGVGVGTASDSLSNIVGTKFTRRILQLTSGVIPALILWYLSTIDGNSTTVNENTMLLNPVTLFAAAQTISAVSLGAVSVSHLEVAPRNAGSLYALGNVAAAISGSITVNIFGRLLEASGNTNFGPSFVLVAALSATGSIIYATTIQTEPEIFLVKRKNTKRIDR